LFPALLACHITLLIALSFVATAETALPDIPANDNRTPAGQLQGNTLTLRLELREGLWHPGDAKGKAIKIYAFAEAGHEATTPGPLIRVPKGAQLDLTIHNRLPVAMFVGGLHERPSKTDDAIKLAPDETQQLHFPAGEPGSFFYWAATGEGGVATRLGPEGMASGAFITDAPGTTPNDRVIVIQLEADHLYQPNFDGALSLNGKGWPYTERLHAQLGVPEHWRIVNTTPLEHPMHLHGFYFRVNAVSDNVKQQDYAPTEERSVVTELVMPGHSFNMTWVPEREGNWIFHCHILDHMMAEKSPVLYGPSGPPAVMQAVHHHEDDPISMGMGDLVMGITVTGQPKVVPAKLSLPASAVEKHLYVRERAATPYVPAGPGFFLEGVSKQVDPIGPPLIVTRGERTAITVHNELNEGTSIHWHGLEIESYYDGVPMWDGTPQHMTPYIAPGGTFVAYMTPPHAGTFIYHTHWNDVRQLTGGMYGALLVMDPGKKYDPSTDKVFVLGRSGLNEMKDPMVLNGSPQPQMVVWPTGKTYRLRLVNITPTDSIVHTSLTSEEHPVKWRAIAKDGADLPVSQAKTLDAVSVISVGETYDYEFTPEHPGAYTLRFSSENGSEVSQVIAVLPPEHPFSVYAAK
jgi:FtsP/CotA-like multicopper oxidase with cupredoxin domain